MSKRLKHLEAHGLIIKKSAAGKKTNEYRLTRCGRELAPIVDHMSKWGLRWARRRINDEDIDVAGFMWDFHRTLNTGELPDGETVICVRFAGLDELGEWWIIANSQIVDLCTDDPGKEVDLNIAGSLPAFVEIWMGDVEISSATDTGQLLMTGPRYLTQTAPRWFPKSRYADIRPERVC